MNLTELKIAVENAIENAGDYEETAEEVNVSIQVNCLDGGAIWAVKDLQCNYDGNLTASGFVITGTNDDQISNETDPAEPLVMKKIAEVKRYLFELQKRYIELREVRDKNKYEASTQDEMLLIGEILKIYGVQKDKLPMTVEKFSKYESNFSA